MKLLNDMKLAKIYYNKIKYVYYNNEKYRVIEWIGNNICKIANDKSVGYISVEDALNKCYVDDTCFGNSNIVYVVANNDMHDPFNYKILKNPENIDCYIGNASTFSIRKYKKILKINFFTDEFKEIHDYDYILEYFNIIFSSNNHMKLPNIVMKFFLIKENKNKTICLYNGKIGAKRNKFIEIMNESFEVDDKKKIIISDNKDDLVDSLFYAKLKDTIDKRVVIYNMDDNYKICGERF